jgi:hypothetical protein
MRVKAESGATSSKKPKSRKARKKPRPFEPVDFLLVYAHVARTRLKHAQHLRPPARGAALLWGPTG